MNRFRTYFLSALFLLISPLLSQGQVKTWSLEECINYALNQNIEVKRADLSSDKNKLYSDQAKANRLPAVNASVRENLSWYKGFDSTIGGYGNSKGSNSTSYALSSSVSIFNGQKLNNKIKQSDLDLQSGRFYSESVKESIQLSILNAYLQVLYAKESVANAEKQMEATTGQLSLAKERLDLGAISTSDYLQIKSELASEKSTLVSAQSQWEMNKVTLMQLMELPVGYDFQVATPVVDSLLVQTDRPEASEIYRLAIGFKPEIKNAELTTQSNSLGVDIAKADALPSLSMDAGLSSGYSSLTTESGYYSQLKNKINPSVGLSLSIPVFQKKQIKTNVALAKIAVSDAELAEIDTKNQLRKEIEQACVNVISAQAEFLSNREQYEATVESYQVSTEKYKNGLLNSVDYLFEKTNLILADSKFLQSKYNLIFSNKVLDFYRGLPLSL